MHRIVRKEELAPGVKLMEVKAPEIAEKARAGQFIILRVDEKGERFPLTIVDASREKGTVTMVFLEVGVSTRKLGMLKAGDYILNLAGPLGNPTEVKKYGTVVCIGGGVGVAAAYPVAKAFKQAGNYVISIIGARNKDLLIFEEEMRSVSDELYVTTDDGSKGRKGFTTDVLKELLEQGRKIDLVYAVGPTIMMKVVSDVTRFHGVKTLVSLNPLMLDGTGMCGGCRVRVGGKIRYTCVEGPEFDGHQVDFVELIQRLKMYKDYEKRALEEFERRCSG